jgi:stage II sporulation protein D
MKRWWLLFALTLHATGTSAQESAILRVGLWTLWHDHEITVRAAQGGPASARTCGRCGAVPLTQEMKLRAEGNAIAFGDKHATEMWLSGAVTLEAHGERVALPYPVHVMARDGVLTMAVTMPVERYVERVVASESGVGDSDKSLKALAVVVRSFALHVRHGHTEYDVCDATHCQLLHWGATGREAAAHAAALRTAGETLWFHGRRAAAWFHQNCGGHTSAPAEVWGAKGDVAPWLVGRADPYCTAHGVRQWSSTLTLEELTRALTDGGLVAPGWKTLTVAKRDESGRAVTLMVGGTAVSAEDFRLAVGRALGWNKISSAWFEVLRVSNASGDEFLFHGRGTGHGVGLCQAGAAAMATQGLNADRILAQYFPAAEVRDEASGLKWQSFERAGYMLETLEDEDQAYLPELDRALTEARSRSGLESSGVISVRTFRSTPEFRAATLAPGWVAAFTENSWIGIQPLRTLAGRKMLEPVMRHEMLHALVESTAGAKAPLWLREGLVEAWSAETPGTVAWSAEKQTTVASKMRLEDVDRKLAQPASEGESEAAHAAAQWYTQKLLESYGRAQVIAWLRNGVPSQAMTAVQH